MLLTGYYYRMACQMTLFARLLDKPEDERRYSELAEKIKAAFKAEFIGKVPDSQCYLSALLYFGMADDKEDVTGGWLKRCARPTAICFAASLAPSLCCAP